MYKYIIVLLLLLLQQFTEMGPKIFFFSLTSERF